MMKMKVQMNRMTKMTRKKRKMMRTFECNGQMQVHWTVWTGQLKMCVNSSVIQSKVGAS